MPWLQEVEGKTPLERVLRTHPALFERFRDFVSLVWSERLVDPIVLETCRIRIAQILGCASELQLRYRPALDAGLTEEKISAIPEYFSSDHFSDHERACISLAEQYTMDAHSISDADFARVAAGWSPCEMMAFLCALAIFDGTSRMRLMLNVDADTGDGLTFVPCPTPDHGPIY